MIKTNFKYLTFAVLFLFFISCKKENPAPSNVGSIKILILPFHQNTPLVNSVSYPTTDGYTLSYNDFNFVLSNINILSQAGVRDTLNDVSFFDFRNLYTTQLANNGLNIVFDQIEPGNYQGIELGVGVDSVTNSKDPAFFQGHPYLGEVGNYWNAWNSYIFSRVEGELDTLPNQAGGVVSYLYHAGVNGMYQTRFFSKNFEVKCGEQTTLIFHLQGDEIFYKGTSSIPVKTNPVSHSGDVGTLGYDIARQVIENISNAFYLQ
jgi:hypothetical protein